MAKVLGKSGRYVSDETARQRQLILITVIVIIGILGFIEGILASTVVHLDHLPTWGKLALMSLILVIIWAIDLWGDQKLDAIEKRRDAMQRGTDGENQVARVLATFPDDFHVIHDLTTPNGNLDHVVVGPTGVFVLDAKNWRGVVTADGKGELVLNGKPTEKPSIRPFVGRMMGVREKIAVLAPNMNAFFKGLLVFTSARVEAKWGTTGNVHCVTDEQLRGYIVEKDFGEKLKPEEVKRIAQAFLGLARMDKDFSADPAS